jgi:membrane protein YqaA with SNARE-associated domain
VSELSAYAALFMSAFLSATLLPGSSEAALLALLALGQGKAGELIAVATAGNVLGSCVNWSIGRFFAHFEGGRWFPFSPRDYDRAADWYGRYGKWSLLLAWLPVVGDPLTLVAGALRTDFRWFLTLVTVGKAARYLFIAGAFHWWSS